MSRVARRKALHGAGVACRSELQPPGGAGGASTRRIAPTYVLPCPRSARKRARKTAHQRCQHLVLPLPRELCLESSALGWTGWIWREEELKDRQS